MDQAPPKGVPLADAPLARSLRATLRLSLPELGDRPLRRGNAAASTMSPGLHDARIVCYHSLFSLLHITRPRAYQFDVSRLEMSAAGNRYTGTHNRGNGAGGPARVLSIAEWVVMCVCRMLLLNFDPHRVPGRRPQRLGGLESRAPGKGYAGFSVDMFSVLHQFPSETRTISGDHHV